MKIDGRFAAGLDEFMLRLGHLKVLAEILPSMAGNRQRLSRRLAEELSRPVPIGSEALQDVGNYLVRKELAQVKLPDGSLKAAHPKARYQNIIVELSPSNVVERIVSANGGAPTLWFQDRGIADHRTRSKVGAVTINREQITNKSGVSHLVDWAVIIGVANKRLGLTSLGRTLRAANKALNDKERDVNPYLLGPERLIFGWSLALVDGDVLARLVPLLARVTTVAKSDAVHLMMEVMDRLQKDAIGQAGGPGSTALKSVRMAKEDIGLLPVRARGRGASPSTVWHRVSSRLETLVDLGFLEKSTPAGEPKHFDYYYRITPALLEANERLSESESITTWAGEHLAALVASTLGITAGDSDSGEEMLAAAALVAGPTGIHIDSFALLSATLALHRGKMLSVAEARRSLETLAIRRPDIARLSRGYSGPRAEFASVLLPKLEAAGPSTFAKP